jgi:hypothetical protein
MLYNKSVNIEATAGQHKLIDMIAGKKVTVLSYNLNSVGGQEIRFKSASGDLTSKLKFEGGNFATLSDSKTSGVIEITGLFHGRLDEDIFLVTTRDEKIDGFVLYADEFNY